MTRLAIADDEPMNRTMLEADIRSLWANPLDVDLFSSLADLVGAGTGAATTHALVDLSFGSMDRSESPVRDTGVDVVDHLLAHAPMCRIAVLTRFDGDPLMPEMVAALRQTWPQICFLHKSDASRIQRVVELLRGEPVPDNALFAVTLSGQPHVPIDVLRDRLLTGIYGRPGVRVLLALSEMTAKPTAHELGSLLHLSRQYIRSVLQWCGLTLRDLRVLGHHEQAGIDRLWLWARARRAILRRAFPEF